MNMLPDLKPSTPRSAHLRELLVCAITAVVAYWLLENWSDVKSGFTDGFLAGWEAESL